MAEWNDRSVRVGTAPAYAVDAGLRAYMLRVYNYMAMGLGLTGVVALFVASNQAVQHAIFGTPLVWLVMFAPLGIVLALSFGVQRMSAQTAQILFWVYAGVMGLSLASIFLIYSHASIARTFFVTAAAFGGLSLWGYTTKRDLTGMGSFLFIGLIGIILASLVNVFWPAPGLTFAISIIGVLIFAGLTAYDTQRIKEMYVSGMDGAAATKSAVMGALRLYLDFINLFLFLLRFMGSQRN
jgi:FtsH-binding integral membrane protein